MFDRSTPEWYDDHVIKVLIIARLAIIREGLKGLLAPERDFRVNVLTRTDSAELVEDIIAEQPDVLIVDVDVLEMEGWALLRDLRDVAPSLASLVISDSDADRRVTSAIRLGARGYLTRDATADELGSAIRAAKNGLFVLHRIPAQTLLAEAESEGPFPAEDERRPPRVYSSEEDLIEPLSARELDVLRLMVRGMSNKRLASELVITEHTVKFHIRSILAKLGAANRTEAVTLALQRGLVSL